MILNCEKNNDNNNYDKNKAKKKRRRREKTERKQMYSRNQCWTIRLAGSTEPQSNHQHKDYTILTLLHSERPKLHRVLAFLSAIGLRQSTVRSNDGSVTYSIHSNIAKISFARPNY